MRYKKLVLFLSLLFITINVQARPLPDHVGVCYEFKGDEIIQRDVCIITEGNAAGGMYANLTLMNGKQYQIASHGIIGLNDNLYDLNGEDAVHYLRDAAFYNIANYERLVEIDEPALYCYKTNSLNLCHN